MIYLFYFPADLADLCYIYTTEEWFSSNFDSLEQLADVGFDNTDKVGLNDPDYVLSANLLPRIDTHESYSDAIFLGTVNTFEELTVENYPEFWI